MRMERDAPHSTGQQRAEEEEGVDQGTDTYGQEPITRSIQLPCVRTTAFSQVGLFLEL